jgi:hypothetical protein
VVWVGLLEKPLEVVCGWPCQTPIAASGGQDVSHARAARHLVMAIIMAGRGHGPLRALLVPLVAALDTLLGIVSTDIERCLHVAARGGLPASLCWVKHDHLIDGGALGGDAARLLERAPEEVAMSILSRALCATFRWCARSFLAGLVVNLRFVALSLSLPWHGLG